MSNSRGYLADTCFWIGVFDPRDQHHTTAAPFFEDHHSSLFFMPWPIMYEFLSTRTVRSRLMVEGFERVLRSGRIIPIDDTGYREHCLEATIDGVKRQNRSISLVDMVIREILKDRQHRIVGLLTFNIRDFRDVCAERRLGYWPT
jgi:predicted nucleic acid-binding protein